MNLASPALLVGFAAEARIARRLGWPVAVGGGTYAGAVQATQRLLGAGATGVVSFGLAGGLDPNLPSGSLIVADAVIADGRIWQTDTALNAQLGGSTGHLGLGLDQVVASQREKQRLHQTVGAALVDMESGAVAATASAARIPFAVLRAICDAADRDLPPAALLALDASGRIAAAGLARSILAHPGQIGALVALARDALAARRALASRISALQRFRRLR